MIDPSQVKDRAEWLGDANYKFRRYLKSHADGDELDRQFLELHVRLFEGYDCSSCRNCCKEQHPILEDDEVAPIAEYLQLTKEGFISTYLKESQGEYEFLETPCVFFKQGEPCLIEACMPRCCKNYPYTDKPERLSRMLGIIGSSYVCPVVFEILEQLKEQYGFK